MYVNDIEWQKCRLKEITGRVIRPSPTTACRIGNEPVRSLWDNVAREQQCSGGKIRKNISNYPEHTGLREQGRSAMENVSELSCEPSWWLISLTMRYRLCQKACRRNDFSNISHSITTFLPADRQFLRHSPSALTWNLVSLYFCCGSAAGQP